MLKRDNSRFLISGKGDYKCSAFEITKTNLHMNQRLPSQFIAIIWVTSVYSTFKVPKVSQIKY